MRFFRFILGRFPVVFLLVIAQALSFVVLFTYLQQALPYYFFANTAITVAAVLIVIRLINRGQNPDYIVPWIIVILILPLSGIVIYLMFSQNRLSRKQKKLYRLIYEKVMPHVQQDAPAKERLSEDDKFMFRQSEYLSFANNLPLYNDTESEYFGTGESFFESLKKEIAKAERFIFLEFFIVERGVLFDSLLELLIHKVEEGVEVRLMYDDIGSIATVGMNFYKKMRKVGIKCVKFNRFLPFASAVHNNRDHRKIAVIDGRAGFVTGANLADEYVNAKKSFKSNWKDSAVLLRGAAVKNLTALFLISYNAQTKSLEDCSSFFNTFSAQNTQVVPPQIASKKEKDKQERQELGFVQPFGDGPRPLYKEKVSQNALLNLITQARDYVYITTPYLIVDFQLSEAIKEAAKRGVDVRIITPKVPDKKLVFLMTRASLPALIKAGAKVYEYTPGFIHSKNILCDGKVGVVGTINLDYRSLVHHFECGVWMYNTPAIKQIAEDFERVFEVSAQITYEESKLKPCQRLIKSVLQLFAPLL